jgi:hypothetical protein
MRWLPCAAFAAATSFASAFTFSDGEFTAWTGWSELQHSATGGNPGAYGRWEASIGGIPGSNLLFRPDFVYNPSVSGAISGLNVALDSYRVINGNPWITSGIVVKQGTQWYIHELPSGGASWGHGEAQNLTANDFNIFFSGSGHPDFTASGGQISFGFFMAYISEGYPGVGGFDNFFVSTEPVPEPGAFVLLSIGAAVLVLRRKKSPS